MKKSSVVMLFIGLFLLGASLQVKCAGGKSKKTNSEKVAKYKNEAKRYIQSAKKAEQAGYQELADLYKECSQCKLKIASKYAGKSDKSEAKAALSKYKETCKKIKKLIRKLKNDEKKSSTKSKKHSTKKRKSSAKKKKLSPQEKAERYKKQSNSFKKMADQQRAKGNTEDASYYDKLSTVKLKISEAYKNNDMKAVEKAQEEYYNFKKAHE